MYSAKQKVSDAAAVAKEHVDILKAKAEEKAEKACARTGEEKEIAHEMRKAKEAEAKMKMHETKAQNAAEKLHGHGHGHHHHHHHHIPLLAGHHPPPHVPVQGTPPPTTTTAAPPTYPLAGSYPPAKH